MSPGMPRIPVVPDVARELGGLAHLLYEWPMRRSPRLALPFCILMAAIVQGSIIILFSISYEAPSHPLPPAPQVYFLPSDSAISRQLAPWLEANDPAAFSPLNAARAALPSPPPLRYKPSYEEPPPPLRPLPEAKEPALEPPPIPLAPPARQAPLQAKLATVAPAAVTPATTVRWQDELSALTPRENTPVLPPRAETAAAKPSLYEVAVNAEGIPAHSVLLESSGDPATDEAGRVWIQARHFAPSERTAWGRVLILWAPPQGAAPTGQRP